MSKSRNRSHSEVEHLRGLTRELKAEVRNLKKRLKELERKEHIFDNPPQDSDYSSDSEDTHVVLCSECGKGVLKLLDLGNFKYSVCSVCGDRRKLNGTEAG